MLHSFSKLSKKMFCSIAYPRNLYAIGKNDLIDEFQSMGIPAYRANQVRKAVYEQGCTSFKDIKGLPLKLRDELTNLYEFGSLENAFEIVSKKDGTIKNAYKLHDGQIIETVLMPYKDGRYTACISSQAGCAMGCTFCATGQMGFFRQLSSSEIFEQAQRASAYLRSTNKGEIKGGRERRLSNIVFMGMGEPLANYKNVIDAVHRINTDLGIGYRHITISTVGIIPRIKKLANEEIQVGLAVSLHQTNDILRSNLMPVNEKYPVRDLLDACRYYNEKTNRRISFEWALIRGQTDDIDTAHELGKLLKGMLCHVNVIPLNTTALFDGKPTKKEEVDQFCSILSTYGISCTPRKRMGQDIEAGCGQLRAELLKRSKKESNCTTTLENVANEDINLKAREAVYASKD